MIGPDLQQILYLTLIANSNIVIKTDECLELVQALLGTIVAYLRLQLHENSSTALIVTRKR